MLGYGAALDTTSPEIGIAAGQAITAFQLIAKVTPDGDCGPETARSLFKQRCAAVEQSKTIPNRYVRRVISLESAYDPGAVGVADPNDHGLAQINAEAHPTTTIAEAFDPAYSIPYLAATIAGAFLKFADWDAAVAAWNVGGGGASTWLAAGKPATGGVSWYPDLYTRATRYVALVKEQPA